MVTIGRKETYEVQAYWDGMWWVLGAATSEKLAIERAEKRTEYWEEFPIRLVREITTSKAEIVRTLRPKRKGK